MCFSQKKIPGLALWPNQAPTQQTMEMLHLRGKQLERTADRLLTAKMKQGAASAIVRAQTELDLTKVA
jgi:hypothetical protein